MLKTLAFAIRWYFLPFVGGLVVSALAGYFALTHEATAPAESLGVSAPPQALALLIYAMVCAGGLVTAARAWVKASRLRHGTR